MKSFCIHQTLMQRTEKYHQWRYKELKNIVSGGTWGVELSILKESQHQKLADMFVSPTAMQR